MKHLLVAGLMTAIAAAPGFALAQVGVGSASANGMGMASGGNAGALAVNNFFPAAPGPSDITTRFAPTVVTPQPAPGGWCQDSGDSLALSIIGTGGGFSFSGSRIPLCVLERIAELTARSAANADKLRQPVLVAQYSAMSYYAVCAMLRAQQIALPPGVCTAANEPSVALVPESASAPSSSGQPVRRLVSNAEAHRIAMELAPPPAAAPKKR